MGFVLPKSNVKLRCNLIDDSDAEEHMWIQDQPSTQNLDSSAVISRL